MKDKRHPFLNRSNLRDITIIVALISSLVYNLDVVRLLISFLLLSFGCFFHYVTKGVLIRNVVLCKDGTYSVVRHPYYMANYLIDSAFCLLSGNVYLLLVYPFLFYWSYGPTIRKEESVLAGIHGEEFLRYSLDVPQIFPDAFSIKSWRAIINGFSKHRITANEISRFARFWATALFIIFIHVVKEDYLARLNLVSLKTDYGSLTLLLLVIVLMMISFVVRSKKKTPDTE
ncbi:MAG: isoprenylcysteine carboxylmethyltransferase family protein [Syntrophorhabdaceae bacterium]|nr:isoprenylcysteine carboxylmethyltransferase family protein [Syntrophorhabdaceae bacterium]MDD5243968.1 isoprenylcysteine carboxylmethyltransferase family protein [Syntrophorhabdaceae bacterium]